MVFCLSWADNSAIVTNYFKMSQKLDTLYCRYENDQEFFKYKLSECNTKCLDRLYDPPKSEDPHLFRLDILCYTFVSFL